MENEEMINTDAEMAPVENQDDENPKFNATTATTEEVNEQAEDVPTEEAAVEPDTTPEQEAAPETPAEEVKADEAQEAHNDGLYDPTRR